MKISHVVASVLVSALVACSGSEEAPASAEQPVAANAPAAPAASEPPAAPAAPAAEPAPAEPTPAPVSTVETCETLAAKAATPAGKLEITSQGGADFVKPVDVYATIKDNQLVIALTETANECGYRLNKLEHHKMGELRIVAELTNGAVAPGDLKATEVQTEGGEACMPEDANSFIGTSWAMSTARGKITITSKTDTSIEGSMEVSGFGRGKTIVKFTAPICGPKVTEGELTCCASKSVDDDL